MMEATNIILGVFFCLGVTRAIVLPKQIETDVNSTESEEATVKEVPKPEMTVHSGPNYDYRLPGYYTFNNGEPFIVEKDPLTGAIDFTKKNTPTATDVSSTDNLKEVAAGSDNEYVYDDEDEIAQEQHQDEIDRRDSNVEGYRPNDIIKSPYKTSPDLHQFLNLPVHYSSNDKFPLISSSYANTKIQGSSGSVSYSNHRYATTSSTASPSYYTFKHTAASTTQVPTTRKTTTITTPTTKTTIITRPTPASTIAVTDIPEDEYENPEDLAYGDYEIDEQFDSQHTEDIKTIKPETTTKLWATTYTPSRGTTRTPITGTHATTVPSGTASANTTTLTTTTTTTTTTSTLSPLEEDKNISIVTSLPLDVYYSSSTHKTETTANSNVHKGVLPLNIGSASSVTLSEPTNPKNISNLYSSTHYMVPNEGYYHVTDGPFRPIFGPAGKPAQSEGSKIKPSDKHTLGGLTNNKGQFHRLPEDQSTAYSQRPSGPPKLIGIEPPTLDQPQNFYSEQPVKIVPGQHTTITFSEPSKANTIVRPIQEPHFDIPDRPLSNKPHYPPLQISTPNLNNKAPGSLPIHHNERPIYSRPDVNKPSHVNGKPFTQMHHKPEEVIYPQQRPTGVIPPSFATKPVSFIDVPPPKLQPQFHQPTKVESHFIKVSPDQENPSYSLQTSFSIGVPSETDESDHQKIRPGQGIGQVLLPDENPHISDGSENSNLPPHRTRPSANIHPPVQNYQPNRPGLRPSGPIYPQQPSPQRIPPSSLPELRPPVHKADNYPRPHWEVHTKPTFLHPQQQNALPKQDIVLPSQFPGLNRIKNENNQRYDLPNILPQFRPNAKVGFEGYSPYFGSSAERLREPVDTLQPPPLPSRPSHLRVNRNDEELSDDASSFEDNNPTHFPPVHRRTGAQASSRVTTLQMMKQGPPRRTLSRNQPERKERPVFVVYPTNSVSKPPSLSEGVVVVGTRGPQKPVHPSNLKPDVDATEDDLDSFPLDDNKKFPIPGRERVDTPVLKTKVTSKPVIKNDFPYTILKPDKIFPEERILSGNTKANEYTAFSPTISSSTEDIQDHDSEINVIPYLQDYMPYAIKRPLTTAKPKSNISVNKTVDNQQISATLNIATTARPIATTEKEKVNKVRPSIVDGSSEGSEFTVSAVMHTHVHQQQQQHQLYQQSHHEPQKLSNHRPETLTHPKPLDFQAPFQASLSAPETQGWSVVKPNIDKVHDEKDRIDNDSDIVSQKPDNEVTKFDFENFKPQLFGGFKPIIPTSSTSESEEKTESKSDKKVSLKLDRKERKL